MVDDEVFVVGIDEHLGSAMKMGRSTCRVDFGGCSYRSHLAAIEKEAELKTTLLKMLLQQVERWFAGGWRSRSRMRRL